MVLTAADTSTPHIAGPIVVIVLIAWGIIYTFGYLRAVMHRANKDYKTTKAAVKPLRKDFWGAWWKAVKIGTLVGIGIVVLLFWAVRDVERGADATPKPTPSVSHSRR